MILNNFWYPPYHRNLSLYNNSHYQTLASQYSECCKKEGNKESECESIIDKDKEFFDDLKLLTKKCFESNNEESEACKDLKNICSSCYVKKE
jgi:hypothetical protein